MNRIVALLMERDQVTEDEAKERLVAAKELLSACDYEEEETEWILRTELGLELSDLEDVVSAC